MQYGLAHGVLKHLVNAAAYVGCSASASSQTRRAHMRNNNSNDCKSSDTWLQEDAPLQPVALDLAPLTPYLKPAPLPDLPQVCTQAAAVL